MIINEDFFDGLDDVEVSDNTDIRIDICYTLSFNFSLKDDKIEERTIKLMNFIQKKILEVFSISQVKVYDAIWMEYIAKDTTCGSHYTEKHNDVSIVYYTNSDVMIDGFFFYVYFDSSLDKISHKSLFKLLRNLDTIVASLSLMDDTSLVLYNNKYYSTLKMPQIFRYMVPMGNPNLNLDKPDLLLSTNRGEDLLKNMYLYSQEWYDITFKALLLNPECTYEKMLIATGINKFGNDYLKYISQNNSGATKVVSLGHL